MAVDKKRAMTDEAYRKGLSPEELAELDAMVSDEELDQIAGGLPPRDQTSTCTGECSSKHRSELLCSGHGPGAK